VVGVSGQLAEFYAAEHRFAVFPCRERTTPGRKAKAPYNENGCSQATTDLDTVRGWWAKWPDAAVGINAGRSGLVVVDCDVPGGDKVLTKPYSSMAGVVDGEDVLCHLLGDDMAWTRSVRTPSGGTHYYYTAPTTGDPIPPRNGQVGPLIDVKASNSYVIAAGSMTEGGRYELLDPQPVQPLSERLARLLRPQRQPVVLRTEKMPAATPYKALETLVRFVLDGVPGQRNDRLWWAAKKAGGDVQKGRYGQGQAAHALEHAALAVGLTAGEIRPTIRSGFRAAVTA
jgi:Bifunctional DNA primase/polymerase, N-terminal